MSFNDFILLMAPEESVPGSGGPPSSDKEDVIKFFGEEDEPAEIIDLSDKKDKENKEKPEETEEKEIDEDEIDASEDEEDDELKQIEDELKEPTEEDLELVIPVRRREILAKYPKLFKEFPYLEKAYYRERKFTEMFPTIEDAETSQRKSDALESFEKELRAGNTEIVLKTIKQFDPNTFNKVVDDYLPTLAKVDEGAYYHIIKGIIKDTVISMARAAKEENNEDLGKAAESLHKFIFNTVKFEPHEPLAKTEPKNEADTKLRAREQQILRENFTKTRDELNTKLDSILRKTIEGNIDTRDSMTEYVKKVASREALESVTSMIDKDTRFKQILDKLWERVIKNDFKKDDVDRIKAAYISKAKTLLPTVIKKARNEALKGMGKRVKEEKEEVETEEIETEAPPKKGRTTPSSNRGQTEKERAKQIPADMSTRDYLMQD